MERESDQLETTPLSSGGGTGAGFAFSKHPAVAPPGWDPTKTESGDGLNERRAVFVLQKFPKPLIPMACGFNDAIHQYGWTGGATAPGAASLGAYLSLIENEIERMVAGDVLVTPIPERFRQDHIDLTQTALDKGIVVVNAHTTLATRDWNYETQQAEFTYTSPVTGEDRGMIIPHVGIRNERGGVAMADEVYGRLQDQSPNQDEYTVFLANDLPDDPPVTRRIDKGAADEGTAQRYFETQDDVAIHEDRVFETPHPEVETSREFVVDTIEGEDVDAVVSSAFWAAVGAGEAREAGDLPGDLLVCGFGLAGMTGTGDDPGSIAAGEVDFVVGQDPYSQGYRSAEIAWTWLERGIPPKDLEWGVSVWDERNIEFATQRRSWEDLLEWQWENYEGLR